MSADWFQVTIPKLDAFGTACKNHMKTTRNQEIVMKPNMKWLTFALVMVLASCVSLTVNVYFPTTEIEKAAEKIEERVRTGQGADGMESSFVPRSSHRVAVAISLGGREAYGEEMNIDIKTPSIKTIIEKRTQRYKKLKSYLDKGWFGEGMKGYLVLLKTKGLDLKTLAALKKLVKEENEDREQLYREILTENDLQVTKENMEKVGKLFFEAIKKKMEVGHLYQVAKKEWKKKEKKENEETK
ncbi:DUF1318 domain-containing protein [bacterium]|nr:DUF1318 domain-containing protein [bacterium]